MTAEPIVRPGLWKKSSDFLARHTGEGAVLNQRERAKARTRVKVMTAARFLFLNLGYEATHVRDIGARIGMSQGAVSATFPGGKADMWVEVMGSPPPTLAVAEEIALIMATRPGWNWLLRTLNGEHVASLSTPDYVPNLRGNHFTGRASSPAKALRQARLAADREYGAPS
jgi:AcrR family transcriptional regulator